MNAQVFSIRATAVAAALTFAAPKPRLAETACGVSVDVASITTFLKALTVAPASTCASTVFSRISARTAASTEAAATLPATAAPCIVSSPIASSSTLPAGRLHARRLRHSTPPGGMCRRSTLPLRSTGPRLPPASVVVLTLLVARSETSPAVAVNCTPPATVTCTVLGAVGDPALRATAQRRARSPSRSGRGLRGERLRTRPACLERDRRGRDRGARHGHLVVAAGIIRRQRQIGSDRVARCVPSAVVVGLAVTLV